MLKLIRKIVAKGKRALRAMVIGLRLLLAGLFPTEYFHGLKKAFERSIVGR
jgi:hypothetical protein